MLSAYYFFRILSPLHPVLPNLTKSYKPSNYLRSGRQSTASAGLVSPRSATKRVSIVGIARAADFVLKNPHSYNPWSQIVGGGEPCRARVCYIWQTPRRQRMLQRSFTGFNRESLF